MIFVHALKDNNKKKTYDCGMSIKFSFHIVGCETTPLADVIFLVQCTSQLLFQDFESIKYFLISVVNNTQIGERLIHFGIIVYSDTPQKFSLNQYNSKRQVLGAITALKPPTGNTYTAKALEYSLTYFSEANGGRRKRGIPQILFVITDGQAADRQNLHAQADKFKAKGINVYGIGVARAQRNDLEIITKNTSRIFQVGNYDALQGLQKNISSVVCDITKPGKNVCFRPKVEQVCPLEASCTHLLTQARQNMTKEKKINILELNNSLCKCRECYSCGTVSVVLILVFSFMENDLQKV